METDALIDQLAADGPLLAAAAARVGWDAPVPATTWNVRQLVTHLGGVHRWAEATVRTAAPDGKVPEHGRVGSGPGERELVDWFLDGHSRLVSTLRAAPADLDCYTFLAAPSPLAFWALRQASETAIHRADAESTGGTIPAYSAEFAQAGMAELLLGFAGRRSNAIATPGTIALAASDGPSWLIRLGGERLIAQEDDSAGDAIVSGTSSELYLWLWNRGSGVAVSGESKLAELWRGVAVNWG